MTLNVLRRLPYCLIAKIVLGTIAAAIGATVLFVATREPRTDRAWDEEFSRTVTAYPQADGTVTIRNLRDFTYGDGTKLTAGWLDAATVNTHEIVRVWFILEPFAEWKAVGHTFLSFELADGSAYAFSIEARREIGESYSAFEGLLATYELAYVWGTERDLVTRRLLYLQHPVRMYPLAVSAKGAQALFISLLQQTNELAIAPRFYNTFTANCTNMLARVVNRTKAGAVPRDLSWYLPGYSDRFLLQAGLFASEGSLEKVQAEYDLTARRNEILALANLPHAQFGTELRRLIAPPTDPR